MLPYPTLLAVNRYLQRGSRILHLILVALVTVRDGVARWRYGRGVDRDRVDGDCLKWSNLGIVGYFPAGE